MEETYAIVEVMGHSVYAGRVAPDTSMGTPMVRVDVPVIEELPAFTKLIAPGSLFAITPCTKEAAERAARACRARPVTVLDITAGSGRRLPGFSDEDFEP